MEVFEPTKLLASGDRLGSVDSYSTGVKNWHAALPPQPASRAQLSMAERARAPACHGVHRWIVWRLVGPARARALRCEQGCLLGQRLLASASSGPFKGSFPWRRSTATQTHPSGLGVTRPRGYYSPSARRIQAQAHVETGHSRTPSSAYTSGSYQRTSGSGA
jgi:hypothetical protein